MAAEPGQRPSLTTDRERRWLDALLVLGTIAVALVAVGLLANLVLFFGDIVIIFFLAWLLAFVLSPIAGLIVRLLPFLPRIVAVVIAYALLIIVVLGLIMLAAQMLAESIGSFVANIPQIQNNLPRTLAPLSDWLNRLGFQVDLVASLKTAISDLGNNLQNIAEPLSQVALASFGTIGNLMIVLFLSIFMALDQDRIVAFTVRLVPPQYAEETRLLERSISRSFGGFLRGQAIMGILYAIVAAGTSLVFGLPYVPATTAFTAVLHAIPFFGPFVSWAPVIAVALFAVPSVSFIPVTVIMLAGWLVTMNVVQPRLMADSVGIHPIVVLGSIIIGGRIAGIPGAIFGIPVAAVLSSFFFYYLNRTAADSRTVAQRAARRVSEREGRQVVPPAPPSLTEVHQQADGTDVFYRGPYTGAYPPSAGQAPPAGPAGPPTPPSGPAGGYPPEGYRP